jgi:hypothetical protein
MPSSTHWSVGWVGSAVTAICLRSAVRYAVDGRGRRTSAPSRSDSRAARGGSGVTACRPPSRNRVSCRRRSRLRPQKYVRTLRHTFFPSFSSITNRIDRWWKDEFHHTSRPVGAVSRLAEICCAENIPVDDACASMLAAEPWAWPLGQFRSARAPGLRSRFKPVGLDH